MNFMFCYCCCLQNLGVGLDLHTHNQLKIVASLDEKETPVVINLYTMVYYAHCMI